MTAVKTTTTNKVEQMPESRKAENEHVSVTAAGKAIHKQPYMVWKLIAEGELELVRFAGRNFVTRASIERFVARHNPRAKAS